MPHQWTPDERRTVHVLFTEYNLTDDQATRIFEAVYPHFTAEMQDSKYRWGYPRQQWDFCLKAGKAKDWLLVRRPNDINGTPYTQAEKDTFARLRYGVQQAAATVGINLAAIAIAQDPNADGYTLGGTYIPPPTQAVGVAATEDEDEDMEDAADGEEQEEGENNGAGGEEGAGEEVDIIDDLDVPEDQAATGEASGSESKKGKSKLRSRPMDDYVPNPVWKSGDEPLTATKVDMIHHRMLSRRNDGRYNWQVGNDSLAERQHLQGGMVLRHDTALYEYGGPLVKVSIGDTTTHVMVCNIDICPVCNRDAEEIDDGESPTDGMPIVHRRDVASREFVRRDTSGDGQHPAVGESGLAVKLKQDYPSEYSSAIPGSWASAKVELKQAGEPGAVYATVAVCDPDKPCAVCDAREGVVVEEE